MLCRRNLDCSGHLGHYSALFLAVPQREYEANMSRVQSTELVITTHSAVCHFTQMKNQDFVQEYCKQNPIFQLELQKAFQAGHILIIC